MSLFRNILVSNRLTGRMVQSKLAKVSKSSHGSTLNSRFSRLFFDAVRGAVASSLVICCCSGQPNNPPYQQLSPNLNANLNNILAVATRYKSPINCDTIHSRCLQLLNRPSQQAQCAHLYRLLTRPLWPTRFPPLTSASMSCATA